jgi:hypothetical protein
VNPDRTETLEARLVSSVVVLEGDLADALVALGHLHEMVLDVVEDEGEEGRARLGVNNGVGGRSLATCLLGLLLLLFKLHVCSDADVRRDQVGMKGGDPVGRQVTKAIDFTDAVGLALVGRANGQIVDSSHDTALYDLRRRDGVAENFVDVQFFAVEESIIVGV